MTEPDSPPSARPVHPALPAEPPVRLGATAAIILGAFAPMRRGRLEMRLPDGSVRVFGDAVETTAAITVRRADFFRKCLLHGDIGFAEAYLDGDWETADLTAVFSWFILNADSAPTLSGGRASLLGLLRFVNRIGHALRPNTRRGARRNIAEHYDLSNDFFALWLDPAMLYSAALFEKPGLSLEEAQRLKMDRLCRKLRLKPGERLLEIGCGWGAFAVYAAREYGVHVTGLTLSVEQAKLARERAAAAGLTERVDIRLVDFRELAGQYDKIVSIEMMEALGHDHLPAFCAALDRLLKPEGIAALQFITVPDTRYDELRRGVDFIQKHIFPGSLLLSLNRVNALLAQNGGFLLADLRELSADYAETLRRWAALFETRREEVSRLGFDERFLRKWRYYLRYCEAAFAGRHIGVVQTVYARPNNPVLGGYPA